MTVYDVTLSIYTEAQLAELFFIIQHVSCYIARMDDNADAKRILSTLPPEDWRRPRERPPITLLSTMQQDLRSHNLTLPEAMDMAQNQSLWRM